MNKEELLEKLLIAFDEKIDFEKEIRAEKDIEKEVFIYCDGRVDGVDAGRFLIEKIFSELDSANEKGVNHCNNHGGFGFTSDCIECKKIS